MKKYKYLLIVIITVVIYSCNDLLEEEVFSSADADEFLQTQQGVEGALIQAYALTRLGGNDINRYTHLDLFSTGTGRYFVAGNWRSFALSLQEWDWTEPTFTIEWNKWYDVVLYANTVIDAAEKGDFPEEFKNIVKGQALALRGYSYFELYSYFGRLPLYTQPTLENEGEGRATEEETEAQIENDLLQAIDLLPENPMEAGLEYGRVYKNSARGLLTKHYLNTKQWQKCVTS